jgi:4a-hydroxytetrahydrobiopterin dehydratase
MIIETRTGRDAAQRSSSMNPLSADDAHARLTKLPGWQLEGAQIAKTFQFKDFVAALQFVNRVGEAAEQAGHHPDIDIRYNRVRLGLSTHDAGGLTNKDFDLAARADQLAQ